MTHEERLEALADLFRVDGIDIVYNVPHSGGPCMPIQISLTAENALLLVEKGEDGPAYLLVEVFGMTIDNAERWLKWAADEYPCRATTVVGKQCRNEADQRVADKVPMGQWREDIHARCRIHAAASVLVP